MVENKNTSGDDNGSDISQDRIDTDTNLVNTAINTDFQTRPMYAINGSIDSNDKKIELLTT